VVSGTIYLYQIAPVRYDWAKDEAPAGEAYISFILFYRKILYNFDMLRELQILAKLSENSAAELPTPEMEQHYA